MKMQRNHANKEMVKLQQQVEGGGRGKEYKMSYNPFVSPEWRTAILTFIMASVFVSRFSCLVPKNSYGTPTLSVASFTNLTSHSLKLFIKL